MMLLVLTPEMLGRTFAEAPDPELARVAFSRVGDDPHARAILLRLEVTEVAARLLGLSTAATDFLVAHPDETEALVDVSARTADSLEAELAADVGLLGAPAGLRRFRRRAMLRVAARDLAGLAPVEAPRLQAAQLRRLAHLVRVVVEHEEPQRLGRGCAAQRLTFHKPPRCARNVSCA